MTKIFIDANVYLGFFSSTSTEFKKLLQSLSELQSLLIVTKQITDEVMRNKLEVYKQSTENYSRISTGFDSLPAHLEKAGEKRIEDWNKRWKEAKASLNSLTNEKDQLLENVFNLIGTSSDSVSNQLAKIFTIAKEPTEGQVERATKRRSLGNPPGKPDDPLGDQLSWEILLDNINAVDELYIVTHDKDYFSHYGKSTILNPFLYQDLIKVNSKIKVHVFNKLSVAFNELNKRRKIESLPPNIEMLIVDEPEVHLHPDFKWSFYNHGTALPTSCPRCGHKDTIVDEGFVPSQRGGITWHYRCANCGQEYDTGYTAD